MAASLANGKMASQASIVISLLALLASVLYAKEIRWHHSIKKNKIDATVGETLIFKYNPNEDSVVQVSDEEAYEKCDSSKPVQDLRTGRDEVHLTTEGKQYYITSNEEHCKNGLKMEVDVKEKTLGLSTAAKAAEAGPGESAASAPAPAAPAPAPAPSNNSVSILSATALVFGVISAVAFFIFFSV